MTNPLFHKMSFEEYLGIWDLRDSLIWAIEKIGDPGTDPVDIYQKEKLTQLLSWLTQELQKI